MGITRNLGMSVQDRAQQLSLLNLLDLLFDSNNEPLFDNDSKRLTCKK